MGFSNSFFRAADAPSVSDIDNSSMAPFDSDNEGFSDIESVSGDSFTVIASLPVDEVSQHTRYLCSLILEHFRLTDAQQRRESFAAIRNYVETNNLEAYANRESNTNEQNAVFNVYQAMLVTEIQVSIQQGNNGFRRPGQ